VLYIYISIYLSYIYIHIDAHRCMLYINRYRIVCQPFLVFRILQVLRKAVLTKLETNVVYIYIYVYICIYVYMYVSTCIHLSINLYLHIQMYPSCMCSPVFAGAPQGRSDEAGDRWSVYIYIFIYVYMYTCMYSLVFTYLSIYIYTYRCIPNTCVPLCVQVLRKAVLTKLETDGVYICTYINIYLYGYV